VGSQLQKLAIELSEPSPITITVHNFWRSAEQRNTEHQILFLLFSVSGRNFAA
jgi:hypothetical protein